VAQKTLSFKKYMHFFSLKDMKILKKSQKWDTALTDKNGDINFTTSLSVCICVDLGPNSVSRPNAIVSIFSKAKP